MDLPNGVVERLLSEARDARRPSMDDVLSVIEAAFGQMNISVSQVTKGPPSWVWQDDEMAQIGFPRYYVLSESNSPGLEGFPLFTIRQAFSVRFDTWVSMSSIVLGPDVSAITRSIALAMAHHSGAFAGIKYTSSTITRNQQVPMAGMVAVKRLLEAEPPEVTAEELDAENAIAASMLRSDADDDKGVMN